MGYRNYIAQMPKREYNKIKSMTGEEFVKFYNIEKDEEGYWHKGPYDFGEELYNFGKYVDFEFPKGSKKKFFKNKEMNNKYSDYEICIVSPEFLESIIDNYKEKVKKYYLDMLNPFFGENDNPSDFLNSVKTSYGSYPNNTHTFDFGKITVKEQTALFKMIEHIRSMSSEWNYLTPFDLKEGKEITQSWKYEYGIFELVRIYKGFDWKRNVMYYYGY